MRRTLVALLACMTLSGLPSGAATITVKAGETLSDIAERYGVSIGSLMRANGLRNSNFVEAGQTLRLPGGVTAGKGRHTVQSGDTLGGIAARYRVSERQLIALNDLASADYLEDIAPTRGCRFRSQSRKGSPYRAVWGHPGWNRSSVPRE